MDGDGRLYLKQSRRNSIVCEPNLNGESKINCIFIFLIEGTFSWLVHLKLMGILKNYLCHLFVKFSSAFLEGTSYITERFMSTNILHHVFIRDGAILNSVSSVCESSLDLLLTLKCQIFSCVIGIH